MEKLDFKRKYPTYYEEELPSTNDALKSMSTSAENGCALIALRQSAGRGRLSRSFLSPEGGLYMSVLYRPQTKGELVSQLTAVSAVAVRRVIERCCGINCAVKWPNDLVYEGRKLCGILTETVWRGGNAAVIIGIGVNVNTMEFPEELRDRAVSVKILTGRDTDLLPLADEILRELDTETESWQRSPEAQLAEYRKHCINVGREVSVNGKKGRALGTGDDYSLLVRYEDGEEEALRFGEVAVRGIYGRD